MTTFLCGCLLDRDGKPVQKANVWTVGTNYAGASPRAGVDIDGGFSIMAQCIAEINVCVLLPGQDDGEIVSKPVKLHFGPFKTGAPATTQELGQLRLSEGKMCE